MPKRVSKTAIKKHRTATKAFKATNSKISPSRILKLLHPKNKISSNTKNKRRHSTRIRFQPLKYWENESIVSNPNKILTMKDINEKGDELLSLTPLKKQNNKDIDDNNNTDTDRDNNMDNNSEYICEQWMEYKNDSYYDLNNFKGTALIYDNNLNIDNKVSKHVVSIPTMTKMKKIERKDLNDIDDENNNKNKDKYRCLIFGGTMLENKIWRTGFLEIPPKCCLRKELTEQTVIFFVHKCDKKSLQFTLYTENNYGFDDVKKSFLLGIGATFHVPYKHYYQLKNMSDTKGVHLTFTTICVD